MIKNLFYLFPTIAGKKTMALLIMLIVFFNSNAQISGSENIYFASEEKVVYILQESSQKIISEGDVVIYLSENVQIENTDLFSFPKENKSQKHTLAGSKQKTSAYKKHNKVCRMLSKDRQSRYRQKPSTTICYTSDSKNTNDAYFGRINTGFASSAGGFSCVKFLKPKVFISIASYKKTLQKIAFFTEYYNCTASKNAHSVRPPPSKLETIC